MLKTPKEDIKKVIGIKTKKNKKKIDKLIKTPELINKCIEHIAKNKGLTYTELIIKQDIGTIINNIDEDPELIEIIANYGEEPEPINLDEEIIKEELKPIEPDNNLIEPITEKEKHLTPKLTEEEDILNRVILLVKDKGQKADNSNLDRILKGNKKITSDIKKAKNQIKPLLERMEEEPTKNGIKNLIGYLDPNKKYIRKM